MRIAASSWPSSTDGANEDGLIICGDMVAVLDGTTARTETGCIHGTTWYVGRLAQSLGANSERTPRDALSVAIGETASQHRETCDLGHVGTPAAAVAIVQLRGPTLRYLLLGDITLVVDTMSKLKIVTDDRVASTARPERAEADAFASGSAEKDRALVRMKRAELASRNTPGGFWVAAADPKIVSHALVDEIPLTQVNRAALLTDGAARAIEPLRLLDWMSLITLLTVSGPDELIRQVRDAEDTDPVGVKWPRNKVHDDATVAFIER